MRALGSVAQGRLLARAVNAEEILPPAKPRRASLELYEPPGILPFDWLAKHQQVIPDTVVFLAPFGHHRSFDAQEIELIQTVNAFRANNATRDFQTVLCAVRVADAAAVATAVLTPPPARAGEAPTSPHVVLLPPIAASSPLGASLLAGLPAGTLPSTDHILSRLVAGAAKTLGVDARACAVLTANDTPAATAAALGRLDVAIADAAGQACRGRIKGIKNDRERVSKGAQPKLSVRYQFKIGHWAEAAGDVTQALRAYGAAYDQLRAMPVRFDAAAAAEARAVGLLLTARICRLRLRAGEPVEALDHFELHVSVFRSYGGPAALRAHALASASLAFSVLAQLLEATPPPALQQLRLSRHAALNAGVAFQRAAELAVSRKRAARELVTRLRASRYEPEDANKLLLPQYLGCAPTEAADAITGPPLPLPADVLAGLPAVPLTPAQHTEVRHLRTVIAVEAAGAAAGLHSARVTSLYTKAYEAFRAERSSRLVIAVAAAIAEEYADAGRHDQALRFFERVAPSYRAERWWPALAAVLQTALRCAKHLGPAYAGHRLRYALELLSPRADAAPDCRWALARQVLAADPDALVPAAGTDGDDAALEDALLPTFSHAAGTGAPPAPVALETAAGSAVLVVHYALAADASDVAFSRRGAAAAGITAAKLLAGDAAASAGAATVTAVGQHRPVDLVLTVTSYFPFAVTLGSLAVEFSDAAYALTLTHAGAPADAPAAAAAAAAAARAANAAASFAASADASAPSALSVSAPPVQLSASADLRFGAGQTRRFVVSLLAAAATDEPLRVASVLAALPPHAVVDAPPAAGAAFAGAEPLWASPAGQDLLLRVPARHCTAFPAATGFVAAQGAVRAAALERELLRRTRPALVLPGDTSNVYHYCGLAPAPSSGAAPAASAASAAERAAVFVDARAPAERAARLDAARLASAALAALAAERLAAVPPPAPVRNKSVSARRKPALATGVVFLRPQPLAPQPVAPDELMPWRVRRDAAVAAALAELKALLATPAALAGVDATDVAAVRAAEAAVALAAAAAVVAGATAVGSAAPALGAAGGPFTRADAVCTDALAVAARVRGAELALGLPGSAPLPADIGTGRDAERELSAGLATVPAPPRAAAAEGKAGGDDDVGAAADAGDDAAHGTADLVGAVFCNQLFPLELVLTAGREGLDAGGCVAVRYEVLAADADATAGPDAATAAAASAVSEPHFAIVDPSAVAAVAAASAPGAPGAAGAGAGVFAADAVVSPLGAIVACTDVHAPLAAARTHAAVAAGSHTHWLARACTTRNAAAAAGHSDGGGSGDAGAVLWPAPALGALPSLRSAPSSLAVSGPAAGVATPALAPFTSHAAVLAVRAPAAPCLLRVTLVAALRAGDGLPVAVERTALIRVAAPFAAATGVPAPGTLAVTLTVAPLVTGAAPLTLTTVTLRGRPSAVVLRPSAAGSERADVSPDGEPVLVAAVDAELAGDEAYTLACGAERVLGTESGGSPAAYVEVRYKCPPTDRVPSPPESTFFVPITNF
jgi:hypothetical protein